MSMTSEEFWMGEARKFESWFYQANYARGQQEAENAKLRELVEAMPYCMAGKCLECPLCSHFEPAIGGVPECKALPMLYALGIYGDDEDKLGVTPF